MIPSFVLDSSMALSWAIRDERTAITYAFLDRLEQEMFVVPEFWFLEVSNALAVAERRQRMNADGTREFLSFIGELRMQIDFESHERAFDHILPLCRKHALTSYDASYLDLAMRRRLPLATLDRKLIEACSALGIEVLG